MSAADEPNTGLPNFEKFYLNVFFKLGCAINSDAAALRSFELSTRDIMQAVDENDIDILSQQILIPRLQGIENASRYWSVLMVLEHLAIVNQRIMDTIRALRNDSQPFESIEIADFKPDPDVDADAIEHFREVNRLYWSFAKSHQPLGTALQWEHPWFGLLDGHQWHCLAAAHQKIHRRQIYKILAMIGVT